MFRPLGTFSTDIAPALTVLRRVADGDRRLYADFVTVGPAFIYPPTAVVELLPLGWVVASTSEETATQLMDAIGRLCIVATLLIAASFSRGAMIRRADWVLSAAVLFAFYPLRWTLTCVQVQSIVTVLLAGAILAYSRRRGILTGILVGLAACLKPYCAPLVLYAAVRKDWRFGFGAVGTGAVLILASIGLMGWAPWQVYLGEIMPTVAGGTGFWPNYGITGIAQRWTGATDFALIPPSRGVSIASTCALVIFLTLAVWPRGHYRHDYNLDGSAGATPSPVPIPVLHRALDLGLATLAVTLASPIAWEHYFAWTVVLFAATWSIAVRAGVGDRIMLLLLGSGYVLLGAYWRPMTAAASGAASLLNAPGFFGALALLAAAWVAHRQLTLHGKAAAQST